MKVQELPFRLLAALLERPGEIVGREELRARLWGDTVVDFEAGLHTALRKLRGVLDDSASHPRFIETIPKRGYRFIAEVVPEPEAIPNPVVLEGPVILAPQEPLAQLARPGKRISWKAFVAMAAVLPFLIVVWALWSRRNAESVLRLEPLVSERGILRNPALSADGERVAFVWAGKSEDNLDIYAQKLDGSERVRLTTDPAPDRYPAWSPDATRIAFLRNNDLMVVPSGGGPERTLTTAGESGLAWSPDSRLIAFCDKSRPEGPSQIYLISPDSGERRPLTLPGSATLEDVWPAFSPDGKRIAFARKRTTVTDLYVLPVAGGEPARVAIVGQPLSGLAWSPGGDQLVFAVGLRGLRVVDAAARNATTFGRLGVAGSEVRSFSLIGDRSSGHTMLAVGHEFSNWDIWTSAANGGPAAPVLDSTRTEQAPRFSPDGTRLAFASDRSGVEEIWVSEIDGSRPRQLTRFGRGLAGSPSWSPDGKRIAFDATILDNRNVYIVDSDGAALRRVTAEASAEAQPSWSHDGRWIYFMSDRTGSKQIWKLRADGVGPAVQVTRGGGYQSFEAPDGKTVYYDKQQGGQGIWSVPADGGREVPVLDAAWHNLWAVARDGIYYLDLGQYSPEVLEIAKPFAVKKLVFATGEVVAVAALNTNLPSNLPAFSVSPDGRRFAWVSDRGRMSNITLVRGLRIPPR